MVDQDPPLPPSPGPRARRAGSAPVALSADDAEDLALVRAIRAAGLGRRDAWERLLLKYQDRIFGTCLRILGPSPQARQTAADLTQDSFVKVLQGLDSWDERARLSTWIFRVVTNVCLSHLRAAKLRRHASLDTQISPSLGRALQQPPTPNSPDSVRSQEGFSLSQDRELGPDQGVQLHEQRRRVAAALASLDPDQRAILVLRDVQGLDYEQIAAALAVAIGTVKSRLFRARLALREVLEQHTHPPSSSPRSSD